MAAYPVSLSSPATDLTRESLMSARTTEAPARANHRAVSAPMPELAPVTKATRPGKSYVGWLIFRSWTRHQRSSCRVPHGLRDAPPTKHLVVRVIEYDDPSDVPSIENVPVALICSLESVACRDELLDREFAGRVKVDQ